MIRVVCPRSSLRFRFLRAQSEQQKEDVVVDVKKTRAVRYRRSAAQSHEQDDKACQGEALGSRADGCSDRYFEDKDTTLSREILHADASTVGVDRLFRDGQAQTKTGLVTI